MDRERLIKECSDFLIKRAWNPTPTDLYDFILSDRKRICESLAKAKNLLYGVLCDPEGTVCISGSSGDRKCAQEGMLLIDEVLTFVGLDEGERL